MYYTIYIGRSKNLEPPRTSNNLVAIRGRASQGSTLRLIDSHGSPSYAQSNYFTQVEPTSSPVTEGPKKKPTNTEVWRVRQLINKMFSKKPALHPAALRLSKLVKMLCCFFIKSAQYCWPSHFAFTSISWLCGRSVRRLCESGPGGQQGSGEDNWDLWGNAGRPKGEAILYQGRPMGPWRGPGNHVGSHHSKHLWMVIKFKSNSRARSKDCDG